MFQTSEKNILFSWRPPSDMRRGRDKEEGRKVGQTSVGTAGGPWCK
jgi:hypothetical protein